MEKESFKILKIQLEILKIYNKKIKQKRSLDVKKSASNLPDKLDHFFNDPFLLVD